MEKLLTECLSPLDNDLLLETILEALPSAELVRGRLVSKRWEECATKVLKKRRDLIIKLNCKNIGKFISSMESSRKQPFPCFDLRCVYYGDENFRKFTQVCRDSVKTLSFDLDNTRTEMKTHGCSCCLEPLLKQQLPVEDDLLQNVILKLGNTLEVLNFWTMPFSDSATRLEVQVTCQANRKIVKLDPVSGCLEVECVCEELAEFCSRTFSLSRSLPVHTCNNKRIISSLKSCGISDLVTKFSIGESDALDQVLYELLDSSIVLEEFDAWFDPEISLDLIILVESFLKMQSKNLKVLSFDYFENKSWRNFQLPVMSELTELKMNSVDEKEGVVQFLTLEGLDLLSNLPKLRSFSLRSNYFFYYKYKRSQRSELESLISNHLPIVPFARLESLAISFEDENVAVVALPYFGQRFPCITKLSLSSATSKILKKVFAVADWGLNLKELKLDFNPVDSRKNINKYGDCGICGFSYEWRKGTGRKLLMDNDQGAILRTPRYPWRRAGIKQFPNLEKLSIEENGCNTANRVKFSDLSIYFGLVNLKRLRSLSISGENKITPEAVKYLKENCPVLRSVVINKR